MSKIKSINEVEIISINNETPKPNQLQILSVISHDYNEYQVNIKVGSEIYSVVASSLELAIQNAKNSGLV